MKTFTRNELLDRLIQVMHDRRSELYVNWYNHGTLSHWEDSQEYPEFATLGVEIDILEEQYD